ncbi:hypothetical protein BDP27DRAFT_1370791 [Rhodocollybia butyracea]|uniref:Uncharacterized protein n=1 Tax=Rhodocollybia butyracea TaxID=206335 RepID=A0A9P5PBL3_9AGAR|nr:hypothetical protein BDP27DRAFT_1370791 [Rhodocollybia butyracea]
MTGDKHVVPIAVCSKGLELLISSQALVLSHPRFVGTAPGKGRHRPPCNGIITVKVKNLSISEPSSAPDHSRNALSMLCLQTPGKMSPSHSICQQALGFVPTNTLLKCQPPFKSEVMDVPSPGPQLRAWPLRYVLVLPLVNSRPMLLQQLHGLFRCTSVSLFASSLSAMLDTVETPSRRFPQLLGPSYIDHLTQDLSFPNLKERVIAPCAMMISYDVESTKGPYDAWAMLLFVIAVKGNQ